MDQRLEFLGDAVLQLIVTNELFIRYSDASEGDLSRSRSAIVSNRSLADAAKEAKLTVSDPESTKQWADAFEIEVGRRYRDSGYNSAVNFVLRYLDFDPDFGHEAKTVLQMHLQMIGSGFEYVTAKSGGSEHKPEFQSVLKISGQDYATGTGSSKRAAETQAAQKALSQLLTV